MSRLLLLLTLLLLLLAAASALLPVPSDATSQCCGTVLSWKLGNCQPVGVLL